MVSSEYVSVSSFLRPSKSSLIDLHLLLNLAIRNAFEIPPVPACLRRWDVEVLACVCW